jgi:hypothetical protein
MLGLAGFIDDSFVIEINMNLIQVLLSFGLDLHFAKAQHGAFLLRFQPPKATGAPSGKITSLSCHTSLPRGKSPIEPAA